MLHRQVWPSRQTWSAYPQDKSALLPPGLTFRAAVNPSVPDARHGSPPAASSVAEAASLLLQNLLLSNRPVVARLAETEIAFRVPLSLLEESDMRILFINNDGGGFADYIDVAEDTRIDQLFADRLPGRRAEDYLIRINRLPASKDQVLRENDRVSMTPTKIEGAA